MLQSDVGADIQESDDPPSPSDEMPVNTSAMDSSLPSLFPSSTLTSTSTEKSPVGSFTNLPSDRLAPSSSSSTESSVNSSTKKGFSHLAVIAISIACSIAVLGVAAALLICRKLQSRTFRNTDDREAIIDPLVINRMTVVNSDRREASSKEATNNVQVDPFADPETPVIVQSQRTDSSNGEARENRVDSISIRRLIEDREFQRQLVNFLSYRMDARQSTAIPESEDAESKPPSYRSDRS